MLHWEKPETAVVSTKGQVVIPESIRSRCHIEKGTRLYFHVEDDKVWFRPVTSDYIARGLGLLKTKGKLGKKLLEERKKERLKEEKKIPRILKHGSR